MSTVTLIFADLVGMQSLGGEAHPAPMAGRILKASFSWAFLGMVALDVAENPDLRAGCSSRLAHGA